MESREVVLMNLFAGQQWRHGTGTMGKERVAKLRE